MWPLEPARDRPLRRLCGGRGRRRAQLDAALPSLSTRRAFRPRRSDGGCTQMFRMFGGSSSLSLWERARVRAPFPEVLRAPPDGPRVAEPVSHVYTGGRSRATGGRFPERVGGLLGALRPIGPAHIVGAQ